MILSYNFLILFQHLMLFNQKLHHQERNMVMQILHWLLSWPGK